MSGFELARLRLKSACYWLREAEATVDQLQRSIADSGVDRDYVLNRVVHAVNDANAGRDEALAAVVNVLEECSRLRGGEHAG